MEREQIFASLTDEEVQDLHTRSLDRFLLEDDGTRSLTQQEVLARSVVQFRKECQRRHISTHRLEFIQVTDE
jgi:hypothetical protein